MSDISGMGNATASGKPEQPARPDGADLSSRNLEERLAIARSKREQVLKEKGKSLSKPVMKRPSFMDDDPAANWDLTTAETEGETRKTAPLPDDEDTSDPEHAAVGTQSVAQTPAPTASNSVSVSWVVIVAFACFFGLGSGIVLSVGAVVAMGWVSLSDLAPQSSPAATRAAAQKPEIYTTVFKPLAQPVPGAARLSLQYSPLTAIETHTRVTPILVSAMEPDTGLESMPSPAPQFDTSGGSEGLVSRLDFQPATIAMKFAVPLPVSASPAPFVAENKDNDVVPQLLAKSAIRPLTDLVSLTAPDVEKNTIRVASVNQVMPRFAETPVLAKTTRGVVPEIVWARLEKPAIFDDAIVLSSTSQEIDLGGVVLASLAQDPPQKSLKADALVYEGPRHDLPTIGEPHVQSPTLATRLGIGKEAAQRITLVTFAPANVPDETLQSYSDVLGSTGFPVANVNRVNFKVSKTHVRYYRNQDRALALALAIEVGGIARDFSNTRVRPPAGQVEVWLEGNRRGVRAATASIPTLSAEERQAALKTQLENRLADRLRRGEHLGGASR